MAKYLSQEWLDLQTVWLAGRSPSAPVPRARMQYADHRRARAATSSTTRVSRTARCSRTTLGEDPRGRVHHARRPTPTSVKVQEGELDANAAFMQGRMKVTGNMGKLMSLMPLTQSPEYKAIQEQIRDITEY